MLLKEIRIPYTDYSASKDFSTVWQNEYPYRRLYKRSIDSRGRSIHFVLKYQCSESPFESELVNPIVLKKCADNAKIVHIIGAGPAGYFAALQALALGLKPIIYERGKAVKERRRDLAKLTKEHSVNPHSNYCFGEGGAGTYSDGKLYTRSKKRGDVNLVLSTLVDFGADENILIDAHPHIGTNKLPEIIEKIRESIKTFGGEIHFNSHLSNIYCTGNRVDAIEINKEHKIEVQNLVLATGHSARDVFKLLYSNKVALAFKPFALGFRIEHPQSWVDKLQHHNINHESLPPAAYSLVTQSSGKGVFSFCMCPGGIIAPCATSNGEIVTNGWSPSKRNNFFANSGFVTEVKEEDVDVESYGVLAGLVLQENIEQKAWAMAGKSQAAPAQLASDYLANKAGEIKECSYLPGVVPSNLNHLFPSAINKSLRNALYDFDKKMPGYIKNALLVAPETRTSSPVQILRDVKTLKSTSHENLYPCAEGAGYAGGIVSAAIDGMRCVQALAQSQVA